MHPFFEVYLGNQQPARRATRLGLIAMLIAVAVSFLMAVKPALWG